MPELPEVETVRMGLAPALEGRTLVHVETRRRDLRIPFPKDFARRLTGRRVTRLRRRAKYIIADLDGGESLAIHLGMSGRFAVFVDGEPRRMGGFYYDATAPNAGTGKHDHVVMLTDSAVRIVFTDPRRFGLMTLVATAELERHKLFEDIGVEPLSNDFNASFLAAALKDKKTPLKSALLDQRVIAGIGNIYACEAMFRAGVSPKRLARSLRRDEIARLVREIRTVLKQSIAAGGSTLRDHRRADGELGYFQKSFRVYEREGEACSRKGCKGTIKRIVQSGRSTYYCPTCQK